MKKLITLEDVKLALANKQKQLPIHKETIITPSARDFARENNIIFSSCDEEISSVNTKSMVANDKNSIDNEKVLTALKQILGIGDCKQNDFSRCKDSLSKFQIVRGNVGIEYEVFDTGIPNNKVWYKEILNSTESPHMAAGLLKIIESSFPWHLSYDEVDYVLEGAVSITLNGVVHTAYAGDVIYIPEGSDVIWNADEYAKLLYITYPANWADLL